MKIFLGTFLLASTILSCTYVDAQDKNFRFGFEGGNSILFGDITNKSIDDPASGYVSMAYSAGIMGQFIFKNNVSITFRSTAFILPRDIESYEADLAESLGLTGDAPYFTENIGAYFSGGGSLGISYFFELNPKVQIEPYLYTGFRILSTPSERMVYQQGTTTNIFEKRQAVFYGFSYTPGVRVNWDFGKFTGLYFFAEYEGVQFGEDDLVVASHNSNQLLVNEVETGYSYGAMSVGLALTLSLNLSEL